MTNATIESTDTTPAPEPLYFNIPSLRLRVRRVYEASVAAQVAGTGSWRARCEHGGSVANAYKYPADTEAALAVRDPAGRVIVWMARLRANKVTDGGSADACLSGARGLFDGRYKGDSDTCKARRAAAWKVIKRAFRREIARRTIPGQVTEALAPGALDAMTDAEFEAMIASHGECAAMVAANG